MQPRAGRRINYNDEERGGIQYNDEDEFYGSLDATEVARSRSVRRWLHLFTVMVIVCFIMLRWLSRSAEVVTKDGRIESVLLTEIPREFENGFWTNHTQLEDATSPMASKSSGFVNNNKDEASTDSTWTLRNPTDSKPTSNESLAPDIKFLEFPEVLYD